MLHISFAFFKSGMPMLELEDIVVILLYCTEGENIDF